MPRNRIDVHTHYLAGAVEDLFASGFALGGGYRMSAEWTPENAIAYMDRQEIAAQVLSAPWTFTGTAEDPQYAARFSRRLNQEYAELIAKHPDRFGAFASVPADSPELALAEIGYALDELGLDGVMLNSNAQGRYFGQPFHEPVLAELARRRVPVFVHPADPPHSDELAFGRSRSVVEFTFDTARNITNAIYTGVFQRYPDLTLILAHCGGPLPSLGWRIAEHTVMGMGPTDAKIDPEHVSGVLRGLYYETALAGSRNSIQPTLEVTGVDHILFGTDWPAAPEPTVVRNIANLAGNGFTEDEMTAVERGNAARLFPRLAG
ncbi:MAG TPA: amidohydrolase family protein [Actinocrinis sp.]|nr:amidohydrolase family protein [Actinocrinis sp.]